MRVLIVRLSAIGDTILTTPLAAAIKDSWPDTEVDWVVEPKSLPIVKMCDVLSHRYEFPRIGRPFGLTSSPPAALGYARRFFSIRRVMAERRYDVALDVQGLLKSGMAAIASGARTRVGWRPADVREMNWAFSNYWISMPRNCHVVDSWLVLLRFLGIEPKRVRFPLAPPSEAKAVAAAFTERLRHDGPLVVMNVGASRAVKCWPVASYADLARRARSDVGALSIFTFGNASEEEMARIAVELSDGGGVLSFATDLYTLAALLQEADLFVGSDTGPTHLAAALGTPVLGLFGATDPARSGPYGPVHRVLSQYSVEGAGGKKRLRSSMDAISVDEVLSELTAMMKGIVPRAQAAARLHDAARY